MVLGNVIDLGCFTVTAQDLEVSHSTEHGILHPCLLKILIMHPGKVRTSDQGSTPDQKKDSKDCANKPLQRITSFFVFSILAKHGNKYMTDSLRFPKEKGAAMTSPFLISCGSRGEGVPGRAPIQLRKQPWQAHRSRRRRRSCHRSVLRPGPRGCWRWRARSRWPHTPAHRR